MKRAIPQEPTPDSHSPLTSSEGARQGLSGTPRRVRTSAAMLGLALSVGASGTLLSQSEKAAAADIPPESFLLAAALPSSGGSIEGSTARSAVYHTVQEGDSLWQIAQAHQVDVQAIKAANSISPDEVLKVGQVLRVPADAETLALDTKAEVATQTLPLHPDSTALSTPEADSADGLASSLSEVEQVETSWVETATPEVKTLASADSSSAADQETDSLQAAASTPQSGLSEPATEVEVDSSPAWVTRSVESSEEVAKTSAAPTAIAPDAPVAPSAAIKTPQQIAALAERIEGADSVAQPAVPVVPAATYRVKPGDTLWTIASRFGLNPDSLVAANGVSNPDLIVAGDVIEIPQQGREASVELASASQDASDGSSASHRIARLRSDNSQPLDRADLYERIRQARSSLETQRAEGKSETSAGETTVASLPNTLPLNDAPAANQANPHVASLIADIRAMQRQRAVALSPVEAATSASTPETTSAEPAASPQLVAAAASAPANSQFVPEASQRTAPAPELLAAAPLSPEAYAPVSDAPTGRTVSPDMPMLPGAGEYLPEAPDRFDGYMWPAQGVLTSGYGWRWGRMHRGVDIAGPVGTPVYAAATGVVVRAGWNSGGYGNLVDIRHPDGSMTRYGHNSRLLVRAGQEVRQGQQIAEMGSTGYSTGPHLHFEVHVPGTGTVNPIAYLPSR